MSIIETIIDIPAEHERKVCGQFDSYLKKIERTLHVSMVARDGEIKVIGPDHAVKRAKSVFSTLLELSKRGEEIGEQNVDYALALSFEDKDTEMLSLDRDIICHTINGKPVKPKTLGQKQYIDLIRKKDDRVRRGTCGNRKNVSWHSPWQSRPLRMGRGGQDHPDTSGHRGGREIRLLPGDLQSKIDPYLRPLYDALYQIMGADSYLHNSEKGLIEVAPLAYMRGRTLDNAFIILDEAQNTTQAQMKMFLTRIGFGSKVIITGDQSQKDLPAGQVSGLDVALKVLKNIDDIGICRFSNEDVVRHPLVQKIVKAYDEYEGREKPERRSYTEHGKKRPGRTGTEMTVTVEYEAEEKLDLPYEEIIKNVIEESLDYVECP